MSEASIGPLLLSIIITLLVSLGFGFFLHRVFDFDTIIPLIITAIITYILLSIAFDVHYVSFDQAKEKEVEIAKGHSDKLRIIEEKKAATRKVEEKKATDRLNTIKKVMLSIKYIGIPCNKSNARILDWNEGISIIKQCPGELKYYLITADLLEEIGDYESAAMLLGRAIDILKQDPPSELICVRLKRYYSHLTDKPRLDKNCIKIYEF